MNIQELIEYIDRNAVSGPIALFDDREPQDISITPDRLCSVTHEMEWRYVLVLFQPEYNGTFPAANALDKFKGFFGFGGSGSTSGRVLDKDYFISYLEGLVASRECSYGTQVRIGIYNYDSSNYYIYLAGKWDHIGALGREFGESTIEACGNNEFVLTNPIDGGRADSSSNICS